MDFSEARPVVWENITTQEDKKKWEGWIQANFSKIKKGLECIRAAGTLKMKIKLL